MAEIFEKQLQQLLNPLAVGGAWAVVNRAADPVCPYIVFNKISGVEEPTIDGYCGIEEMLYQIDIYAKSYGVGKKLAGLVAQKINENFPQNSIKETEQDAGFSPAVGEYRTLCEYRFWLLA